MNNPILLYILLSVIIVLTIVLFYNNKKKNNIPDSSVSQDRNVFDKNILDELYKEINSLKIERESLKNKVTEIENSQFLQSNLLSGDERNLELLKKLTEVEKEKEQLLSKYQILEKEFVQKIGILDEKIEVGKNEKGIEEVLAIKNKLENELEKNINEKNKIKEELEELQDDIEDLEDDLKKFKNQLKESNDENERLELENNSLKKDEVQLREKNSELSEELEVNKSSVALKEQSLQFVNEILEAQVNGREEENESLILLASYMQNDILGFLSNYYEDSVISDLKEEIWSWYNTEIKTWIKKKTVVAIVGEFSAGKTSIVNRILSQDDPNAVLLPVSSKETTAIPTYISKGIDFNCKFYAHNHSLNNIKKETFEMVTKSILDDVKVSSLIKYFVVSYNNKYLDNLSILDTPGFASNSDEIIKRTSDVVKESDAIFWVVDANTGDVNQTSLKVMKEHLHSIPLYIILNKCDTKSPSDLESLQEKIEKTLKNNAIEFTSIVRFSKNEDVSTLIKILKSVKVENEIDIVHNLLDYIEDCEDYFTKNYQSVLSDGSKISDNINICESNFSVVVKNNEYYINEALSCIDFKSPFIGSDYYRIEQGNYNYFKNNMLSLEESGEKLKRYVPEYKLFVEENVKCNLERHEIKYSKERLQEIGDRFKVLINNYNK